VTVTNLPVPQRGGNFLGQLSSGPFFKHSAPWRQPGTMLEIKLCVLRWFVAKDKVTRGVRQVGEEDVKSSAKMGDPLALAQSPLQCCSPAMSLVRGNG